ncbi:MAG: hypothetical protein NC183_07015 [Corallococcus sp.]|nr:hypothetical protein [Corallococcus sp.]
MKRHIFVFVLAFVMFAVMLYFMPQRFENAIPADSQVACYVYCRHTDVESVNVGYGYIVKCSADNLNEVIAQCRLIDGVSVSFKADTETFWQIVEQCELKNMLTEEFSSLVTARGYSPKLTGGVYIDGMLVNVQLACDGENIYVGSPLILGSF